eukprot:TRINITY_DN5632_c0_g1_i1.p2 TRINITY_DN5632_c0_g1~~TRINITY_DN5632_c0_g1_i1.p2  ORF type:complete len:174 (-),score=55.77 TRINITY_DN5632_c0_g1_i1:10-531(-)
MRRERDLVAQLDSVKGELDVLRRQKQDNEQELMHHLGTLTDAKEQLQRQAHGLQESNNSFEEELRRLQAEQAVERSRMQELVHQYEAVVSSRSQLEQQVRELVDSNANFEATLSDIRTQQVTERDLAQQVETQQQIQIQTLQRDIAQLRSDLSALQANERHTAMQLQAQSTGT